MKKSGVFRAAYGISLLAWICLLQPAHAYTLTQTTHGNLIRWQYGQKFFLAGNPANRSGISPDSIWNAMVHGLQQWKRATEGQFDFDYWQGTDPLIYSPFQNQDGLNSIFFASQTGKKTDPNVIGHTQFWFNSDSGTLIETDIVLNDVDYDLTDHPMDTSSYDEGSRKKVYLNNVVTHELGHALGLSHSSSINSSMLYVEFSEQNKLGCDDWSGARHLYPSFGNGTGEINGTLISPEGLRIKGAVVTAISESRGIPLASVNSDQLGNFHFGSLEEGKYFLMIDSYPGIPSSVPAQLRIDSKNPVCGHGKISKKWILDESGTALKPFLVQSSRVSSTGFIQIDCQDFFPSSTGVPAPKAFVDRAVAGSVREYVFQANGKFSITALGYLLLSPIKVALTLIDESGAPVFGQEKKILFRSANSRFTIEDEMLSGTAFGSVRVRAEIMELSGKAYPSPAIWPDPHPYFVVLFNDHPESTVTGKLPNNARCEIREDFPEYHSPPGNPVRFATASSTRDPIGFCGTAQASVLKYDHPSDASKKTPITSIFSWFLPLWVAIVCQLYLKSRRYKLGA